ncbi:MAG: DUF4364 family protein [Christensenellaceae bacterium]
MPVRGETLLNKLILLFIFDKMEIPLSEETIIDMCTVNDWLSQMDCKPTIAQLLESSFIYKEPSGGKQLYSITPDGRVCLADFFVNIPTSVREQISRFVKANRNKYKKRQEYVADYYRNNDGSYTVYLKILEAQGTQLELKLNVPTRQSAKNIFEKWQDKAENIFVTIYENLVD